MPNPTIVVANLDDAELKASIEQMVKDLDTGLNEMTTRTDKAVKKMQESLKSVGNSIKSNSVGSSSKQVQENEKIEQSVNNISRAYDRMLASKAKSSLRMSYARAQAIPTDEYDLAVAKLERLQALLQKNRTVSFMSPSQILAAENEIKRLETYIKGVEAATIRSGNAAQNAGKVAINVSQERLEAERKFAQETLQREYEARMAVQQTGQAARQTARDIIQSMHEQASQAGNAPIEGYKQLYDAITQMRRAYYDMSAEEKASPIGMALEQDIKKAEKAITIIQKYNQSLSQKGNNSTLITNQSTLESLRQSLKTVTDQFNKLTVAELNAGKGDAIIQNFQDITRAAQILQKTLSRPVSFEAAKNLQERTLDDIAHKLQKLKEYKLGIDITKPDAAARITEVDREINRLTKDMNKYMTMGKQVEQTNNAISRSVNYMKNRLAFYFTVGASTQFVKSLIDIRSQYEMNERALGILINSAERGTQIFKELSEMALVSPYTLIELSSAAKQLVAYDVAARDVVDTTRRLADMASAVGVPMERLTYALGQIKAYGYLNSRDARMFANAGIPLVKQLADYYTELEGKMVNTAEVYDRMKKKAIDYNDVMAVVTKMTDDGGKFFNFQAKMADTLKVRLANLTLAWNNMMNEIGAAKQGLLTGTIGALKEIFLKWKDINSIINSLIKTFGIFKAIQFGVLLVSGQLATAAGWQILLGKKLQTILWGLTQSFWKLVTTPLTWWALLAVAVGSAINAFSEANEAVANFNKAVRDGAEDNYNSISRFADQYKQIRDSLYTKKDGKTVPVDIDKNEAKKAWEAVREEIELTSKNAETYIGQLLSISNMSERVRQGFNILDNISAVNAALKELDDDSIKIEQDFSQWWNLWMLPDGLIGNLNDLKEAQDKLVESLGRLPNSNLEVAIDKDYSKALERFRRDLDVTTQSILNFINLKGWSGDTEKINEVFKQIIDKISIDNQLDPQKAFILQLEVEEARSKAAKNALAQRINDEAAAYKVAQNENARTAIKARYDALREEYATFEKFNGMTRVYWTDFTKWLKEQHISETREMFKGMDAAQIQSLNFQEGKYKEWVTRMVTQYAKEHKLSYDSAFDYLKNWVTNANKWSIFIPLTISTEENKSIYETLTEADTAIDTAYKKIQRLKKRQEELNIKGGVNSRDDQVRKDSEKIVEEIAAAEKDYNDALAKGGHSKKEDAAATKEQKKAETELQKALKEELQLIEKVRSAYKELTKAGVTHSEAIESSISGYEKSVANINGVLKKYGLELDLSKFAGISNPHEILAMLQKQLDALTGKAKPAEIQAFEVEIKKINLDVKKFDATQVTEGLNRELGKIKDEYELALELDANPELGNMFADMFNIDTSELPHTFGQALARVQESVNKALRGINVDDSFDILNGDIKAFASTTKLALEGDVVKSMEKAQKYVRDLWKKNTEETIKNWNTLLEKYGDYQTKLIKAVQDTAKEQLDIVRKFGNSEEQAEAINLSKKITVASDLDDVNRIQEQLKVLVDKVVKGKDIGIKLAASVEKSNAKTRAKIEWDTFKDSDYYAIMFEDMDRVSTRAIRSILEQLDVLKAKVKEDPASMKALMDAYKKGRDELESRSPFENIITSLKEWRAASIEVKDANIELTAANKELKDAQTELANAKADANNPNARFGGDADRAERMAKAQERYAKAVKNKQTTEAKAAQAEIRQISAQTKFQNALNGSATALQNVGGLLTQFAELLGITEDSEAGEMVKSLAQGFNLMATALTLVAAAAALAQMSLGWVAAVAAGLSVVVGLVSFLAGSSNRKITAQIEEIERDVHDLEIAYKNLEQAADDAYGAMVSGAKAALIANKQAQLDDLERQYKLAKSRTGKHYDQDEVDKYHDAIVDLRNEIHELTQDITNELLDISSAGDGITSLVEVMIDAFKNGEDAMEAFGKKWDEMIDNMILKLIVSTFMQKAWDDVMRTLKDKEAEFMQKAADERAEAQKQYDQVRDMSDDEVAKMIANQLGYEGLLSGKKDEVKNAMQRGSLHSRGNANSGYYFYIDAWQQVTDEEIAAFRKMLESAVNNTEGSIDKASTEYTQWALDYMSGEGRDYMTNYAEMLKAALGDWYTYGQDSQKNLSALQQGLQSMSEDTAGALEAYMNNVSQQVYLQNDLLIQIRDVILGFDVDIQTATLGQILLQLQNSYQVQMSIQNMLEGALNPSGRAFMVELNS